METDLDQLFVHCSNVIGELLVFVSPGSVMDFVFPVLKGEVFPTLFGERNPMHLVGSAVRR